MLTLVGTVAMTLASGLPGQAAATTEPATPPAPEHAILVYEWAAVTAPCEVAWTTIGGVAGVASNHTLLDRSTLDETSAITEEGQIEPAIFGPPLDGSPGRALVADSDAGTLDGDDRHDRAVGPFQFVPRTWERYGADGNGDGVADPQNLWDAAMAAAALLCDKGVTEDLDRALTGYFGTDQWNDWVHRRRRELVAYELTRPADGPAVKVEVVARTTDARAAPDPSPTPTESAGAVITSPIGPSVSSSLPTAALGDTEVAGDWTGDGRLESATLIIDDDSARFERRDDRGRPFGAPLLLDPHLPRAEPQQISLVPVAGDWDGNGVDSLGLVVVVQAEAMVLLFDERAELIEHRDLGQLDVLVAEFEVRSVDDPVVGPEPTFWKTVTVHDGREVRLFRVGEIAVAEALAQPLSELLGAAAAEGIELRGWGWRSHQEQIELRRAHCADVWATPAADCTPPTAVPGTSRHEFGLAVDFHLDGTALTATSPAFAWLAANAGAYGLSNLPSEPWHWSTDGG